MRLKMLVAGAALAGMTAAHASPTNLVVNGSFESTSATYKAKFHGKVDGWSGGTGLDFIDTPGTADDAGRYLAVYGPFANHSPDGGNFVEADGDRNYGTAIWQTITGLTAGARYAVSFYQAAGQQRAYLGPTSERWDVSLGDETHASSTFHLLQGGVGDWQRQTIHFTATAASEVLSFFAAGTPNGKPPIAFLDGVSLTASAPEPATWALLVAGFGLVGVGLRRRGEAVA